MNNRTTTIAAAVVLAAASTAARAAPVFWIAAAGGNDHWYEMVSVPNGPGSFRKGWNDARADALARTHLGLNGYLATVTSAAENLFLGSLDGPFQTRGGWLGGSDAAVEGEWRWADGPEAGLLFWLGTSTGSSPGDAAWGGSWPNFCCVEHSTAMPPPNGVPVPGALTLAAQAPAALCVVRPRRLAITGSVA